MSTINLFNSHRWSQDTTENVKIREWLYEDNYYTFKFYEVSKSDFDEGNGILTGNLKSKIDHRIKISSVVIAFNNQSISYDPKSVHAYEIKEAIYQNKPIVLISKQSMYEIPSIYKNYEKLVQCNWNSNSIREAIKKANRM